MNDDHARLGRPRSDRARSAVLNAVDDLLVEIGYGAMTMKGIAERAGVGRQTVYRWWSTKAQILAEAIGEDAPLELAVTPSGDLRRDLTAYLDALTHFLQASDAGAAYRALLGEAQHDPHVAGLLARCDVLSDSARLVIEAAAPTRSRRTVDQAVLIMVGPIVFGTLTNAENTTPIRDVIVDAVARLLAPAPTAR